MPLYKKLHEKSCCYLVIIYMKKASLKGKASEILTACALVVICIHVSALDSCYMTNALDFSQSEARKFFVYILSIGNNMISSEIWSQQAQVNFSKTTNCIRITTLHWQNRLVFSQSELRNFFRYIITRRQRVRFRIKLPTNKHRPNKQQKKKQMRGLYACQAPKSKESIRLRLVFPPLSSSCLLLLYKNTKLLYLLTSLIHA